MVFYRILYRILGVTKVQNLRRIFHTFGESRRDMPLSRAHVPHVRVVDSFARLSSRDRRHDRRCRPRRGV
jgi:hypothetical protein